MKNKKCYRCLQRKLFTEFYKDKTKPEGIGSECKNCAKQRRKENYIKPHYERADIMEKVCSHCRTKLPIIEFTFNPCMKDGYNNYCRKCVSAAFKKHQHKHREKRILKARLWAQSRPYRTWASHTLNAHKYRGFKINISLDDLEKLAKNTPVCAFCGILLNWSYGTEKNGKIQQNSPTLDRIFNDPLLNINNIQILCHRHNTMKGNRPMPDFIKECKMISDKFSYLLETPVI